VTPETIAADLIKQVGPRGDFMTTEHTIQRLRGDEFLTPRVSVRSSRASWESAGSKDTYQIARDKVQEMSRTAGSPIDPVRAAKLEEIIQSLA
jgi:trimethylamine--corrinoid protein Co-methyltransferase